MESLMDDDSSEDNVFTFQDKHPAPDPVFSYPDNLHQNAIPLIIDNGSYKCRVGWATDEEPRLIFKNLIAKQRSKKSPDAIEVQIGNDIGNVEVVRWQLKSQFDRNIITQYDTQEQILDYIFSHLGINTVGSVNHPILLTEPICNPNFCRNKMSELMFECYDVPSMAYGIDAMFSLYKNHPCPEMADALVISCGYNTTHVVPVLNGKVQTQHCRRLNLGGCQMEGFLQKILQLKYPGHFAQLTLSRAEEIMKQHCFFAVNYAEEVAKWSCEDYYVDNVVKYQLPFSVAATNTLVQEAQKEKRQQQVNRLKELNAKKREEKLTEEQDQLNELMMLHELYEDEDDETLQRALEQHGINSVEHLQETITKLSASIQRARYKIVMEEADNKPIGTDLLNIPDEMLTPEQQEQKRRQKLVKAIGIETQKKTATKTEKKLDLGDLVPDDPEAMDDWIKELRKNRQRILDVRSDRKQRKTDMTKRRTQASQQRMKIITELARGSRKKKEDTFGQNDDDWNVYKAINKDAGDSDSEAEAEKLEEIETLLREYDQDFKDPIEANQVIDVKEYYRVHVGLEKIRVPELLFQPSMIGSDQSGIAETIAFVLSKFSPEEQERLVKYVYVTGGCASFPNMKQRIETELLEMRPFQSKFEVHIADNPAMDAWLGARKWALTPEFKSHSMSRKEYEEMNGDYLKEHFSSNLFIPQPVLKGSPVKPSTPKAGSSPKASAVDSN